MFTRFVYHCLTCTVKIGPVCSIYSFFMCFFFVFKKKCFCYLMSSRSSIQLGYFALIGLEKIKFVYTPRFLPCTSLFGLESTSNAIPSSVSSKKQKAVTIHVPCSFLSVCLQRCHLPTGKTGMGVTQTWTICPILMRILIWIPALRYPRSVLDCAPLCCFLVPQIFLLGSRNYLLCHSTGFSNDGTSVCALSNQTNNLLTLCSELWSFPNGAQLVRGIALHWQNTHKKKSMLKHIK